MAMPHCDTHPLLWLVGHALKKSFGQFDSQPFFLNDQNFCIILLKFYYFENKIEQKGSLKKN
jgi:hypothetical protein